MARIAIQEGSLLAALDAISGRLADGSEARRVLDLIRRRQGRSLDFFREEALARIARSRGEALAAQLVIRAGGDPLRPAGRPVPGEAHARSSIFRSAHDREALRAAREDITRALPRRARSRRRRTAAGEESRVRP